MATPHSPVIPGQERFEIRLKADDAAADVLGLPILRLADDQGTAVTRWKLTWRERWALFRGGFLWIATRTGWEEFQPTIILAECPGVSGGELTRGGGAPDRAEQPPS